MYILLDMEDMVVRHKHPDHSTLSSLAKIELSHTRAKVIPLALSNVCSLSDMEIRLLHSHVLKQPIAKATLHSLAGELFAALLKLPDSDVNVFEVKHQAAQIALADNGFYRYVKGAYKAQRLDELFTPCAVDVTSPAHVAPVPAPAPAVQQQPVKTVPQTPQPTGVLPSWHPANKRV